MLIELTLISVAVYVYFGIDIQPSPHSIACSTDNGLKALNKPSTNEYSFGSYFCNVFNFFDLYSYVALVPSNRDEKAPILEQETSGCIICYGTAGGADQETKKVFEENNPFLMC
jgi:hypothetical protein